MRLSETELVRIEFNDADYEALRRYAAERDTTVDEAVRAALDELEAPDAGTANGAADARRLDDLVEEWSEDDVEFTLAEDP